MNNISDTIIAPATPQGQSAIAVIRLSGQKAIQITDVIFKGAPLELAASHTIHYGWIMDGDKAIDEVMVAVFRSPKTFTTEDVTEISCHGSPQIVQNILHLAVLHGAKHAFPGEFTLRAFLNGRLDLSQAEAVADIIHSSSSKSSEIALKQLKGHLSSQLRELRQELIDFAALIELELDFSEEDVEFAHRGKLKTLIQNIFTVIQPMMESFRWGNSIKDGIPVAIIGAPNAGKSTLLNALLKEEKALVSDIAGTTRDFIEDTVIIDGICFRFIDTAGIRETSDVLEGMGIERSRQKLKEADIILYLTDINTHHEVILTELASLDISNKQKTLILLNKADTVSVEIATSKQDQLSAESGTNTAIITAKDSHTLSPIYQFIRQYIAEQASSDGTIITNQRHYDALRLTKASLERVLEGLNSGLSSDFVAMDIREGLYHLGTITGEVSTDDLLERIFSKFCIGK